MLDGINLNKLKWICPDCNERLITNAWMPNWKICETLYCNYTIDLLKVDIIQKEGK